MTVTFSILIVISVVKSVQSMTPKRQPTASQPLSTRECVERCQALLEELEQRRHGLTKAASVRSVDQDWTKFRVGWLQEERALESQCDTGAPDRAALAKTFSDLEKLMDLYTTHVVQFAGEVGPTLEAVRTSLARARESSGAP